MRIIDCHVHAISSGNYEEDNLWLVSRMLKQGIEQMIVSDLGDGWLHFPDEKTLHEANRRIHKFAAASAGRVNHLVYINPQLDNWRGEFELYRSSAVGVKLWVSLKTAEDPSLEKSKQVLRAAAQYDLPVLIHTFERTCGNLPGEVGIDDVLELARAVPECRILAAHTFGNWRLAIKRAAEFPENIRFDVSGIFPERTMIERLTAVFGSKRIFYGTDAAGRSFGAMIKTIQNSAVTDEEKADILYRNAESFFKLRKPAEAVPVNCVSDGSIPVLEASEDHFCFAGRSPWWDHDISAADLAAEAERSGIKKLFAASLDAVSAADKITANTVWRLEAEKYPAIHPLAAVDLRNMDRAWEQLENMQDFAGVWISPYLHDYKLDAAAFEEFFKQCAKLKIQIWINTALGDDRFRQPSLVTRPVTADEITAFCNAAPENIYTFQGVAAPELLMDLLPEHCFMEYSRFADGEIRRKALSGNCRQLRRGSEYPFRCYRCVDEARGNDAVLKK